MDYLYTRVAHGWDTGGTRVQGGRILLDVMPEGTLEGERQGAGVGAT